MSDEEFNKVLRQAFPSLKRTVKKIIQKSWLKKGKANLKYRRRMIDSFELRLATTYGKAFDQLDFFILLNKEISEITHDRYRTSLDRKDLRKFDVLIRLHGRACQVASEILVLLRSGYPDGAFARWRTLHEIYVTFLVLVDNDNELVARYDDYEVIEAAKKAKEYNEGHKMLGWRKLDRRRIAKLESERSRLVAQYGSEFAKQYGWAAQILPKQHERNFRGLESLVRKNHLRFIYVWACDNVHSGVSGIRKTLSKVGNDQMVLMGPSNYGLADPGQFTSYTLLNMTREILLWDDSLSGELQIETLEDIQEKIADAFVRSQKSTSTER